MKNFIYVFSLAFILSSCGQADCKCEVESNGFAPMDGQTVMMGSQASVDVVVAMDKAWAARDYDALKSFIADEATLQFEDGQTATNGDEFVAIIDKQYQEGLAEGNSGEWKFRYAFSIKPSKPEGTDYANNRGEWVNAGFDGSDGNYNEWYQVEDGKIISWTQTKAEISTDK